MEALVQMKNAAKDRINVIAYELEGCRVEDAALARERAALDLRQASLVGKQKGREDEVRKLEEFMAACDMTQEQIVLVTPLLKLDARPLRSTKPLRVVVSAVESFRSTPTPPHGNMADPRRTRMRSIDVVEAMKARGDGPASIAEVAEMMTSTYEQDGLGGKVAAVLMALTVQGAMMRVGRGVYRLPEGN
jgi:hypothetical protein